jgi:phosphoglycerate dehydrogenase-like enzyme
MNHIDKIAVCSRSFSKNEFLRKEISKFYENIIFNDEGLILEGESLINFLKGRTKAIIGLETITEEILENLPELRVIAKYGVGTDKLDIQALKKFGVKLGWTPGVNKRSVSELVVAFAISLLRQVSIANKDLINGKWSQFVGRELSGKAVGIIGCGNVGKDVVQLLSAFGCKVYVYDIKMYEDFYIKHNVTAIALEELMKISDIVTIHTPLNDQTKNLIDRKMLQLLKKDAILINIARGGIVDELCVDEMLRTNKLGGAAFDVFECEPVGMIRMLTYPNFLATPHIGGSSIEAITAMGMAAINGLEDNSLI